MARHPKREPHRKDYTHENSFFMVSIYIKITHIKIHFLWSVFISRLHTSKFIFYGQYLYQDYTHQNSFFMVSIYIKITHMKIHFYGQYLYQLLLLWYGLVRSYKEIKIPRQ